MRLSGRGVGMLAVGLIAAAGGTLFGYPELVVLGFACLVAVFAALVLVAWRPALRVRRAAQPDRVTRGEPSQLSVTISNDSRFFGASLLARDRVHPGQPVPVPLVALRPGKQASVEYPVPTSRRAVVEVGPLRVSRRDPLGLASSARDYGDSTKVWVRPRAYPIAAVPVGLSRSMDGRVDRVPHGSITFAALREYVVGDDLRQVHWRTSARVGELMVREHVDTSLPRVVILLDDRASAHTNGGTGESTFESACEAAASVLVASAREGIQVELILVGGAAGQANGVNIAGLLDLLAEATLTGAASLRSALQRLRTRRRGDTLLYLTGPPDKDDLGAVAGLRGAYPSIIAGVFGPVESGLAESAGLLVVGAIDGADFAAAWDGVRAW